MPLSSPRKQTFFVLLLSVIAVGGVGAYVLGQKDTSSAMLQADAGIVARSQDPIATTTDWQKSFPTIAQSATKSQSATDGTNDTDGNTLTDRLGRSFFARFMELQKSGSADNEAAVNDSVNATINDLLFTAQQPKIYTSTDIKVSVAQGDKALRDYANSAGALFYTYAPRMDMTSMVTDALENNKPEQLAGVDPVIKGYSKLLAEYLKMSVPPELSDLHVQLVNGVSSMLYVAQGLRTVSTDPAQGLVALALYATAQDTLRTSMIGLSDYLDSAGVRFGDNETGRIFSTIH